MNLHYESSGTGEPLILIPGFASGAWIWYRQTADLAKDFRVITFDPRGVANSKLSESLAQTVTIRQIADDVADLMTKLRLDSAHILGASFGGFVAQEFALNHPQKVKKLVLACTSFGGKNHVAPSWEVIRAFSLNDGLSRAERIRKFLRPAFSVEFAEKNAPEIEKVYRLREAGFVPESVYLSQLEAAFTFDAERRLRNMKAETLIITGDEDLIVPKQNSENLAQAIPNSQLKIIKKSGHLFFIEKPQEFNQSIMNFLKS